MRIQAAHQSKSSYNILTESQLKKLKFRNYTQQSRSILTPHVASLCIKLLPLLPTWLAPNVISLLGLMANILVALVFMWHCPTATEQVPTWLSMLLIASTILNYILNTLDGAQARHLDQCSPLGEILDHCSDSIVLYSLGFAFACVAKLGVNPYLLFWLPFVCHWAAYSKQMSFFARDSYITNWIDTTEIHFIKIIITVLLAIFGDHILLHKLPYPLSGFTVQEVIGVVFILHAASITVLKIYETFSIPKERNKFYISNNSVVLSLLPMVFLTACAIYIFEYSRFRIDLSDLLIASHMFAAVAVRLTWNIYVADLFQEHVMLKEFCLTAPLALMVIDHFDLPVDTSLALVGCTIFGWVSNAVFMGQLCLDISKYLKVNIFTITQKDSRDQ